MNFINKKKVEGKVMITVPGVKINVTEGKEPHVVYDCELETFTGTSVGACEARAYTLLAISADYKIIQWDGFGKAIPFASEVFLFGSDDEYREFLITRCKWSSSSQKYVDAMQIHQSLRRQLSRRDGLVTIVKADGKVLLS
jgi:hypothetical protein